MATNAASCPLSHQNSTKGSAPQETCVTPDLADHGSHKLVAQLIRSSGAAAHQVARKAARTLSFKRLNSCIPRAPISALPILVHQLHSGNPATQKTAALQLLELCTDPNHSHHILTAAAGVIPDLVHLLRSKDATVQKAAAKILWHLSSCNEDYCITITAAGGLPALAQLLQTASLAADPATQEAAARTLWSLASSDHGFDQCCTFIATPAAGLLPALVHLLSSSPSSAVQLAAAGVLINMSAHTASCAALVSTAGAIPAMMQLLQSTEESMLLELILGTLYNLLTNFPVDSSSASAPTAAGPPSAAAAAVSDAVKLLVTLLCSSSSTGVQAGAAKLLWALCHHYQQQQQLSQHQHIVCCIAAAGAIPALIRLLQSDDAESQEAAISVLAHLTTATNDATDADSISTAAVSAAVQPADSLWAPHCSSSTWEVCKNADGNSSSCCSTSSILEQMVAAGGIPALHKLLHDDQGEQLRLLAAVELGKLCAVVEYRRVIRGEAVVIGDLLELMRCSEEEQETEQANWAYLQLVGPRDGGEKEAKD